MIVLVIPAGLAAADYETTVRNTAVVTFQFFLRNKVYSGVILIKVIRHGLDLILDSRKISTFLCYYKALSCVFLSCGKLRILAASYSFQCGLYRNCVLLAILNTINTADCIRMSLAYALAPKCIILAVSQDCICIHTVQREHSRIPAYGNNSNMTILRSSLIYIGKMLWNSLMGIKTVYYVKPLRILRCLLRKVGSTSSAEDHNVDLVFHLLCVIYRIYLGCLSQDLNSLRSTTGKYAHQFHIRIMFDGALYATS